MGKAVRVIAALLIGGCSDTGVTKYNSNPEVSISSHNDGDTVQEGIPEPMRGQVGDPNHSIEELSVTWLVDGVETCEDSTPDEEGVVVCDMVFGADGGEVSLEVRDPEGAGAVASVTLDIQPTDAPTATITAPDDEGVYYAEQLITFSGTVSDTEDAPNTLAVEWASETDGIIEGAMNEPDSAGQLLGATTLSQGDHFITLTVTDRTGKTGRTSTAITVGPPNAAPSCAITAPEDGITTTYGEAVRFEATTSDPNELPEALTVVWSSDKDGELGRPMASTDGDIVFVFGDLSVNTHVITLTVTDELDASCSTEMVLIVATPPTVRIERPADDALLNAREAVTFEATVEDNEDAPDAVDLRWESDADGEFSTESADSSGVVTLSTDSLSPGTHRITVTATDTHGLSSTDSITVELNEPPNAPIVELEPEEPTTLDNLVTTASGSEDPEGTGSIVYSYSWFEDGDPVIGASGVTLSATSTRKHRTYRVEVVASDGDFVGPTTSAEVTVINSPPTLDGPHLSTDTVAVGDVVTCTATASDVDPEDAPSLTYAWSDGSTELAYTVRDEDAVGSELVCTATADDGDGGVVTNSVSITVSNNPPDITSIDIAPAPAHNDDTLTCSATASDAEGGAPTVRYAWSGGSRGDWSTDVEGPNLPLTTELAAPGDTIKCTVTAVDGEGISSVADTSIVLHNRPPTVSVALSPDRPNKDDPITCTASGITDADADTPTVSFRWKIDETIVASDSTSEFISTLDSGFMAGQTVLCTATVDDGHGGTSSASASVEIDDLPPVITSVMLTPEEPTTNNTVTAVAIATDGDGEYVTMRYEFTVDDVVVQEGTENTLDGRTHFAKGQTVGVTVTAEHDREPDTKTASPVTVQNTPPTPPVISITADNNCPVGWTLMNDGARCARVFEIDTTNWETAQAECEGHDGDLVSILSAEDNDLIETLASETPGNGLWIGYNDRSTEAVWVWASGETGGYENWRTEGAPPEPNGGTIENCAEVLLPASEPPAEPWHWNDAPCVMGTGHNGGYVCQTEVGDGLVCTIDEPAADDDGDDISYHFAWDESGEEFTGAVTTVYAGDTVAHMDLVVGEEWTCEVTPDDGEALGGYASASHEVMACDNDVDGVAALHCGGTDCYDDDPTVSDCWQQITTGMSHSCGLTGMDTLLCWGDDSYGQSSPPEGNFAMVDAGANHSCGVDATERAICWGDDTSGKASPPSDRFVAVSAAATHSCGVTTTGTIECWGSNTHGESTPPTGGDYIDVTTGSHHSCGLQASGSVDCWGYADEGATSPPASTSFERLSAGAYHTCGIATDGAAQCWGRDGRGESSPPGWTYLEISAGFAYTCAVIASGDLTCWGDMDTMDIPISSVPFSGISAAEFHTCGVDTLGQAHCWGRDASGESTVPVPEP